MNNTLVKIGELETETACDVQGNQSGAIGGIPGVPLCNDGQLDYWLPTGNTVVVLEYVDNVWRVTFDPSNDYLDSHSYRLDPGQAPWLTLPMRSGLARARLVPGQVYEIHHLSDDETRPLGWWLFRRDGGTTDQRFVPMRLEESGLLPNESTIVRPTGDDWAY